MKNSPISPISGLFQPHMEKPNVLLVDDRPENLLALENILEDIDCTLFKATSGPAALQLVVKHDFALVLLDVQMPEMNGFEVAQLMRSAKQTKHVPIIFVTAISKEDKYLFKGYESGAVDYLFKPISPDILKSKARIFIELHQQKTLLQQQAKELARAREAAEKATKAKSAFLASMSHELRTPLNAVIGHTSMALTELWKSAPLDQLQHLVKAEQSARILMQVINNVLDFSKIEAGEMEILIEELDLDELIEEIVITAEGLVMDKPVEVTSDLEADLPCVQSDYVKVKQILNNLIGNAIKFTTEGFVAVRAKLIEAGTIIRVEIEDTGIGIPQENLGHIFESFKQAHSSAKKSFGGTGLGLAITKQLCEMLKIQLVVRSEEGKGTTFWLHIPIQLNDVESTRKEATSKSEKAEAARAENLETGRDRWQVSELTDPERDAEEPSEYYVIIAVDDDEMNLDLIGDIFAQKGYVLLKAHSGQEGIDLASEKQPDIILMDLMMSDIDGFEATQRLKQDPRTAHIPVVAYSALVTEEAKERALQAGCTAYITKPVKPQKLVEQLTKLMLETKA